MILRRVEPVLVENERIGGRADFQKPMPVDVVSGKARDLEAEYDAGVAEAHFSHQMTEPLPVGCAGFPEVTVDDDDLFLTPAEFQCPLAKSVLPPRALGVLDHLAQRGLVDVEIGGSLEMVLGHFARHRFAPCRHPIIIAVNT